jgi:light-regulated signal transduction histidine kinase (bacteriophytochrome)
MHARDEATAARAELDRWLYAAGHDLAEPARTIKSFLALLERRHGAMLDNDAREFIGFAVDAASRLEAMLDALLELGRIGREPSPEDPVDLGTVIDYVLARLGPRLDEVGGRVEIEALPAVTGSAKLWRRLIGILLENALLYRGSAPPLVRIAGDEARLTVADNGIGIEPRFHSRIFEPFQRLHTRDAIPGCGMGLTIARRIAAHLGCTLDVEAAEGGGSVFVVALPSAQAAP